MIKIFLIQLFLQLIKVYKIIQMKRALRKLRKRKNKVGTIVKERELVTGDKIESVSE